MTYSFNTLALLLFFSFALTAQTYTRADSAAIYLLLDKADDETLSGSLEKSLQYAKEAEALSRSKKMLRGEGFAKLKIADVLVQQSVYKGLNELYQDSYKISVELRDSFMMALSLYQRGQWQMYEGNLVEAEKLFNHSLGVYFEKNQSSYTANVYNDIGYVHGEKNELEKQAYWILRAIRVQEKVEDIVGLSLSYNNMATVYRELGELDKAILFTREAIAIREKLNDITGLSTSYENLSRLYWGTSLDSASKYQQIAMQYAEKSGLQSMVIRSYDNLSVLMDKRRNKKEALAYIQKAIELNRKLGVTPQLADRIRWAAVLCADLKDTAMMEAYFKEAYELSLPLNNKKIIRDLYAGKASSYRKLGYFEQAYLNLEKFYVYKDSVLKDEAAVSIAELETKYETEKKDNEIVRLNTEQRIRQLEIDKQKAVISGNKLEAQQKENEIKLLSQQQELRDSRIQQQAEELEKQLLLARNNQQQLKLAEQEKLLRDKQLQNQRLVRNLMIGGVVALLVLAWVLFNRYQLKKRLQQQKELLNVRNNIAKDLHDEIGSTLTSIKILSQVSQNNLQKDQQKASSLLEKITEQSAQMQQGMSDIVWAIRPDNDKLENIVVRMREYVAHTLESKNIETSFKVDEDALSLSLDMQQRKDFFLIFKEAVNNTAKYSSAKKVDISVEKSDSELLLRVADNGVGFEEAVASSSNGLKNMRARATALHGSLELHSTLGAGTVILARIPTT